jgi:hypothetical protein
MAEASRATFALQNLTNALLPPSVVTREVAQRRREFVYETIPTHQRTCERSNGFQTLHQLENHQSFDSAAHSRVQLG